MDRWEAGGEVGLSDSREAVRNGAEAKAMLIVHVHVHAKAESVADFRQTKLGLQRTLGAGHVSPLGLEMNLGPKAGHPAFLSVKLRLKRLDSRAELLFATNLMRKAVPEPSTRSVISEFGIDTRPPLVGGQSHFHRRLIQ